MGSQDVQLYTAIAQAGSMPFQVILGRHIPGLKVTWSLKIKNDTGETGEFYSNHTYFLGGLTVNLIIKKRGEE